MLKPWEESEMDGNLLRLPASPGTPAATALFTELAWLCYHPWWIYWHFDRGPQHKKMRGRTRPHDYCTDKWCPSCIRSPAPWATNLATCRIINLLISHTNSQHLSCYCPHSQLPRLEAAFLSSPKSNLSGITDDVSRSIILVLTTKPSHSPCCCLSRDI